MSMLKHVLSFFAFLIISITQVCAVESRGYSLQVLNGKQTHEKLTSETSSILLYFGSLGLGSTSIKIANDTDSFKYELKDSSLD